jgi:MFS transporter, DHA1 family, inner membrane transport protein
MNLRSEQSLAGKQPYGSRAFDPRVWILALGTFAIGTDAYVISGILPSVARDLHVAVNSAGQIVTWYSLTYAIAAPVLAVIVGRANRTYVIMAALVLFSAANCLCAVTTSFALLIAARVVAGIAGGLYTPTAFTLAAALAAPAKKSKALAAVLSGLTLSTALGVPIGTLLGQHVDWHSTFWFVVALSVVAVLMIGASNMPPGDASYSSSPGLVARFEPLVHGSTLLALAPACIFSAGYFCLYTYLGAILGAHGFPAGQIAAIFLASGVGAVLGSFAGGHLVAHFRPIGVLTITFAVTATIAALFGWPEGSFWSITLSILFLSGSGWLFLPPHQTRLLLIVEPRHAQVVMALNSTCIYVGVAAGTAAGAGIIRGGFNLQDLHWVTSGLMCIALLILALSYLRSGK